MRGKVNLPMELAQPSTRRGRTLLELLLAITVLCMLLACTRENAPGEIPSKIDKPTAASSRGGIQGKIERLQNLLPEWVESGGNPEEIGSRMQKFQQAMQSGKPAEAEAKLDEVLALLEKTPAKASEKELVTRNVSQEGCAITPPRKVTLGKLPPNAAIVFHKGRDDTGRPPLVERPTVGDEIYVMSRDGAQVTQITFDNAQYYEHVAVSHDRTKIAANRIVRDKDGLKSTLWVLDLERQSEAQLVGYFHSAGGGGVDWDRSGFIHFAGEKDRSYVPGGKAEVYKIRPDGTGLTQLTFAGSGMADVGLSEDGTLVAYLRIVRKRLASRMTLVPQIWVMETDGSHNQLVFDPSDAPIIHRNPVSGNEEYVGAHDPTPSPDKKQVVFSRGNPKFSNRPSGAAHDLYVVNMDGTGLRRITPEGPISIIPDWQDGEIVYTEINESDQYLGISVVKPDGTAQRRLGPGHSAKWIPPVSGK